MHGIISLPDATSYDKPLKNMGINKAQNSCLILKTILKISVQNQSFIWGKNIFFLQYYN